MPLTRLPSLAVLFATLILVAACAQEPVAPYTQQPTAGDVPEARQIDYSAPEYSEEISPSEESLDSVPAGAMSDNLSDSTGGREDMAYAETDSYKKDHGRSSGQLVPIYFDFDQASLRSDQFPVLEKNADFLKNNPSLKVIIQGNSDERGTNEYNLALAERRALNAKTYLIEVGVAEYRIRTVSFGEERPLFEGSNEEAWAMNRRDDFVIE